jgi:hypothetical protein
MRFPILLFLGLLTTAACGSENRHLPSSNPPEYDPSLVYATQPGIPEGASGISATQVTPHRPGTESLTIQAVETRNTKLVVQPTSSAELVRGILAGGPNGRTALLKAMTASGFAVLDSQKRIVTGVPQVPEMGLPLEEREVDILARAAADQLTMPFADFETDVALAVGDEQGGRVLIRMLLNEIRNGINDTSPTVRSWAGLIVELGRQSPEAYDLLTVTDTSSVRLNGLQQVLILKHLSAEFFALAIQRAIPALSRRDAPSHDEPALLHRVSDPAQRVRRVSSLNAGDPCGFGTDEGIRTSEQASMWGWSLKFVFGPLRQATEELPLLDLYRRVADTVDTRTSKAFVERMKALQEIDYSKAETAQLNKLVKTMSQLHSLATALLSLAELTAVMNAVKIDISMDPAPPLERTKTRQPGHYAKLAASLSFDINNLDLPKQVDLHCAGRVFMGLGLDFSMPENGPIKGADVEWTLVEGGTKMDSKAGYKITEAIVELENPGPRIQDAGVGFGDVKKSVRTNENGVAKVGIHGAPQKRDLGRDPQPVKKRATVRANVQLKPADMFRDLADALKGPWALPAQVLYRSHLLGKNYSFDVIDWSPPIRLLIHHRIRHDPQSKSSKAGWVQFDGTVQFEIHLEPIAEGWFRGEIDVVRPLLVRHVTACSGSGSQTENWSVSARVDPQTDLMNMTFSFLSSNRRASWTCGSDIHVNLGGTMLKSVQLPAKDGTTKDFTARDIKFLESLSVTVVEGID